MLKGPAGQVQRKPEARIRLRVDVPLIGDKPAGKVRLARAGNTPQHHQPPERLVDTHSSYSYSTATAAKHPPKAPPERRMGCAEPALSSQVTATAERWRTSADRSKVTLKTTKVQAFGGSNPSPSAGFEDTFTVEMLRDFA
jgi:hypothetical protein